MAMFARVQVGEGSPEQIDALRSQLAGAMPALRQVPGLKAGLWLANESGRGYAITVYESREAMDSRRQAAEEFASRLAEATGVRVVETQEHEVLQALL